MSFLILKIPCLHFPSTEITGAIPGPLVISVYVGVEDLNLGIHDAMVSNQITEKISPAIRKVLS